jgi:hypothetical protein
MKINKTPLPFLALSMFAFFFALWAGLLRLGWQLPTPVSSLAILHGPLMISGFLGSLISLERVVALKIRWMYLAPLFAGVGWVTTLLIPKQVFGPIILTFASFGGVLILGYIARREFALHTVTMFLGALAWFAGNVFWVTGSAIFQVVYWWQAFLILTIAGERLELSRVLRTSRAQQTIFMGIIVVFIAGVVTTMGAMQVGVRLCGAGMAALTVWSISNDIAWRNLRHRLPLTRYIAWCLALGFIWLGIGGLINLRYGAQAAGPMYDAVLHAVFVGFVISMIFGHAPIIFPAIIGTPISFYPAFYVHLALLHISLALRVASDLALFNSGRMWGGLLNEIAILLFLGMTIYSVRKSMSAAS